MERLLSPAACATEMAKEVYVGWEEVYVGWEEVSVCSEKGRREIHYVLKRRDGGSDLAVIAKEKSLRHMTFRFLLDFHCFAKPTSKKEVVDWLSSFTPECFSNQAIGLCSAVRNVVNQFVHVLAEEKKRLVAYLDDMYEDKKGNKMVVVRWFHKIDEIGIDLPRNFNDREIFSSLCLQDLSVECIDGFTTVLSPRHYTKFMSKAEHALLQPYMCCQQYDSDDLKPLDITQVKGYWKQDVIRYMSSLPSARTLENASLPEYSWKEEDISTFNGS